ncbi:MAG: hypothetical protein K2X66_12945, partial [Cyanobacteria bacterium]|nr:hypothetical protein [Cyanobacteriota bacterium]
NPEYKEVAQIMNAGLVVNGEHHLIGHINEKGEAFQGSKKVGYVNDFLEVFKETPNGAIRVGHLDKEGKVTNLKGEELGTLESKKFTGKELGAVAVLTLLSGENNGYGTVVAENTVTKAALASNPNSVNTVHHYHHNNDNLLLWMMVYNNYINNNHSYMNNTWRPPASSLSRYSSSWTPRTTTGAHATPSHIGSHSSVKSSTASGSKSGSSVSGVSRGGIGATGAGHAAAGHSGASG